MLLAVLMLKQHDQFSVSFFKIVSCEVPLVLSIAVNREQTCVYKQI